MSKRKRKRKNDEQNPLLQQLEDCGVVVIRLVAGLLMLMLIGAMLVLVYLKFLYPGFEISVWLTATGLFSYLSGYLAFEWSGDNDDSEEKRKNDWQDEYPDKFDEDE